MIGPGGVGKTRLAVEFLATCLEGWREGAWFVDFSPLRDPALVVPSIAAVLEIREHVGTSLLESLCSSLEDRQLVLLFDNCEHVVASCAAVSESLLRVCKQLQILATSREPLRIGGEYLLRVPSLDAPPPDVPLTVAGAHDYPAVALFLERAQAVAARLQPSDGNLETIATICRRLDGIPLAIELAAARVNLLDLSQIEDRLAARFALLTGGSRTALSRQQTLRATLEWSHQLLDAREQIAFRRLGIFAEGWTLPAAEAVCSDGTAIYRSDIVHVLGALVDKSLVIAEMEAERPRYRLLETTREYALEALDASGERQELARRHAEYFSERLERFDERWDRTAVWAWLAPLEADLDNFRTALSWALGPGGADAQLGARLIVSLRVPFFYLGLSVEGIRWAEAALRGARDGLDPALHAEVHLTLAQFYLLTGPLSAALAAAQRAQDRYRQLGDRRNLAEALRLNGQAAQWLGQRDDAVRAYDEALLVARELGEQRLIGVLLWRKAQVTGPAHLGARRTFLVEAGAIFDRVHYDHGRALVLAAFGEAAYLDGDVLGAREYARMALAEFERNNDRTNVAANYSDIAGYCCALDDIEEGRQTAREAIATARSVGASMIVACAIGHLAAVASARGAAHRAARLLGASDAQFATFGQVRDPLEQSFYDRTRAALRASFRDDATLRTQMSDGGAWSIERAVLEALDIE